MGEEHCFISFQLVFKLLLSEVAEPTVDVETEEVPEQENTSAGQVNYGDKVPLDHQVAEHAEAVVTCATRSALLWITLI